MMERDRLLKYLYIVLRIIFVTANNIYCIPTYALWMFILLPLLHWKPHLYWYIEGKLFHWLLAMVSAWSWSAGYTIQEVGEDISSCYNQECLLVVNHQSTADVPLLMAAFQHKETVVSNMMWLMDKFFKYTNFGVVSLIHGDFFIKSGKDVREGQLQNLKDHLLNVYITRRRKWLVLFPEGGFLRNRKETSKRFAKKNNLPDLENVSLPRLGAMHVAITALSPAVRLEANHEAYSDCDTSRTQMDANNSLARMTSSSVQGENKKDYQPLKWVIDITIGYENQQPLGLLDIITGSRVPCVTTFYYRRYPIQEVPKQLSDLTQWLYERWVEKEQMLNEFYTTGKFPVTPSRHSKLLMEPIQVTLNNTWLISLHVFFIASTLFHFYILRGLSVLFWE